MKGHKSVVSALAICNGTLYSGSWDGTVGLWSLSDHSLLALLGEGEVGSMSSVFSLSANQHTLVAAHENGLLKVSSVFETYSSSSGTFIYLWPINMEIGWK